MEKKFFAEAAERVLVVEESRFDRFLLVRKLGSWGYRVESAADCEEAFHLFCSCAPRIVITDLILPKKDGFALIKYIRERELNHTYIIVLSGMEDKESVVRALSMGADDYLTKPFHPEELRSRLQSAQRVMTLESQEMLIFALARLAEYRSNETGHHLERVQHFVKILAQDMAQHGFDALTPPIIEMFYSLSPLHDIGKVAIPDHILHKSGKLTDDEFEIVKQHTVIGGNLLYELYRKNQSVRLEVARDIVLYHHERFDGRGYPHGLKGRDIPLCARIMAVADVFDALSSMRCYKPAFSREKCRRVIEEERGKHFDPAVVDAFLRQEDTFWEIRKRFPM